MEVNIKKLVLGSEKGIFDGYLDIYVQNRDVLDSLIKKLRSIDGVQKVVRTDI